jgi:hypothetical protein
MGVAKFLDDSKGGNHLQNFVQSLCQNQRLILSSSGTSLKTSLAIYLLLFVCSQYGLAKVVPVAQDMGFEIIKNCMELFPKPFQTFFPGGDGIIHAVNILQDALAAHVVGADNKQPIASKAIKMVGEPGAIFKLQASAGSFRVSCAFRFCS